MPKREINPVPEMIAGQKWEVREAEKADEAYVDLKKKQMIVPLDESETSELVRSHELMHVAITPFDKKIEVDAFVENRTLQAVEDARVYSELKRVGVDPSRVDIAAKERYDLPLVRPYIESKGGNEDTVQLEMARLLIARRNTGSEGWLREGIKEQGCERSVEAVDKVVEKFFQPYESKKQQVPFESVLEACSYLHEYFSPDPLKGGEGEGDKKPDKDGAPQQGIKGEDTEDEETEGEDSESDGEEGEQQQKEGKRGQSSEPKREKRKTVAPISPLKINDKKVKELPKISAKEKEEAVEAGIINDMTFPDGSVSGTMEIVRPPLTVRHKPSKGRRKVNTDLGVNPKNLYRATIDQKVFSEKAIRDYGVAILIDCSGSMNVSQGQIEKIMKECPAAVVAIYASHSSERRESLRGGKLKIIVENKMRIDSSIELHEGMGGGNVVDLPAIKWLAGRKEDRKIWVSDGFVTGVSDKHLGAEGVRQISRLVLDNRIKNVRSVAELITRRRELIGG